MQFSTDRNSAPRPIGRFQLVALFCFVAFVGCNVPVEHHDWSAYDGPGKAYFEKEEFELPYHHDPLEPVNRLTYGLNTGLVAGVIDPLATGWRFLVPQDVRTGMVNAVNNATFPQRGVNHLLQGNTEAAGNETARFGINTTAGVAGVIDYADDKKGIRQDNTDTGMTFNKWGWRESAYLVSPMGGPDTIRDAVGGVGDLFLNPLVYFYPLGVGIERGIVGSEGAHDLKRYLLTNKDPYDSSRRLYLASREIIEDTPPTESADTAATQTLNYATLRTRDPWFAYKVKERQAYIKMTRKDLPYSVWMNDGSDAVVFLLPGFGGHRHSQQNLALAELFFDAGYSVATISSPTNFEFMQFAGTTPLPSYAPIDSADAHAAIDAVWRDLRVEYGNRVLKRMLVGSSLGGYQTLYIAANNSGELIDFDAYLAINPPVQLEQAAKEIDNYYNALMNYPEGERKDRAVVALQKGASLSFGSPSAPLTFGDDEAQFLVGLSYRLSLHDMIWSAREKAEIEELKTEWSPLLKASASQEILSYSLMEYAYGFLFPYLNENRQTVSDAGTMFAMANLRSLGSILQSKRNVGVMTNENDFLLSDGDIDWLETVFTNSRLNVNQTGGHLGNLDDSTVRSSIIELLSRLLASEHTEIDS